MTEGDDDDGTAEQESPTTTFVDISHISPDGLGSGTGVVFFSTNSTGQLAFLDNMVGINDSELSQGAAPLEFGNGRVERFHLRFVVLMPHYYGKPDYPHEYATGRIKK